jgi:DNA-binding beta-propeller fold protein YncE
VAVDGAGNVFIADFGSNTLNEWSAATQTLSTLVDVGLRGPEGVAVDGAGNVFITGCSRSGIKDSGGKRAVVADDRLELPVLVSCQRGTPFLA